MSKIHRLPSSTSSPTVEFTERVLRYSPTLAAAIGSNESLLLLQLIWLLTSRRAHIVDLDGEPWLRMGVRGWADQLGVSVGTAQATLARLKELDLVYSRVERLGTLWKVNWFQAQHLPGITISNLPWCSESERSVQDLNDERSEVEHERSGIERSGVQELNTSISLDEDGSKSNTNTPPTPQGNAGGFGLDSGFPSLEEVIRYCQTATSIPPERVERLFVRQMANGWKRPGTNYRYEHWGYGMVDLYNWENDRNKKPQEGKNASRTSTEPTESHEERIKRVAALGKQQRLAANDG